jgi:hypothetical protein
MSFAVDLYCELQKRAKPRSDMCALSGRYDVTATYSCLPPTRSGQ